VIAYKITVKRPESYSHLVIASNTPGQAKSFAFPYFIAEITGNNAIHYTNLRAQRSTEHDEEAMLFAYTSIIFRQSLPHPIRTPN